MDLFKKLARGIGLICLNLFFGWVAFYLAVLFLGWLADVINPHGY